METYLYATVGDRVVQIKNKRGQLEEKTVEGKIVWGLSAPQEITPMWFKGWYDWLQSGHPGCIVRFSDTHKGVAVNG